MKKINASIRKANFYTHLELSKTTITNYKSALNSSFLKEELKGTFEVLDIFEINDIEKLWQLYSKINLHPRNIKNHRAYSAAIMKYIRFLNNGEKYGRRIDHNKPKNETGYYRK